MKTTKINKQIYLLEEDEYKEHCNCYLIIGSDKCLLIDVGIGFLNKKKILDLCNGKPLMKIVTHFHFDHYGGYHDFGKIFANKSNIEKNKDVGLKYLCKTDFKNDSFEKIKDNSFQIEASCFKQIGECINLGDVKLKVILTPGHDKTSISLFEPKEKILFSGDLIYDGKLYFDFLDSDIKEFIASIKKVLDLKPKMILGGHNKPIILTKDVYLCKQDL